MLENNGQKHRETMRQMHDEWKKKGVEFNSGEGVSKTVRVGKLYGKTREQIMKEQRDAEP